MMHLLMAMVLVHVESLPIDVSDLRCRQGKTVLRTGDRQTISMNLLVDTKDKRRFEEKFIKAGIRVEPRVPTLGGALLRSHGGYVLYFRAKCRNPKEAVIDLSKVIGNRILQSLDFTLDGGISIGFREDRSEAQLSSVYPELFFAAGKKPSLAKGMYLWLTTFPGANGSPGVSFLNVRQPK